MIRQELYIILTFAAWIGLLILCLSLTGCKTVEPSIQIGDNVKEQITIAYNNLPKECKSPEREREFNLAVKQVDSLTATCEVEKVPLRQKIRYQTVEIYALLALSILLGVGFLRKLLV